MTQLKIYAYVVLDMSQTPPKVVALELTRKAAREVVKRWAGLAGKDQLRVRRASVKLFDS